MAEQVEAAPAEVDAWSVEIYDMPLPGQIFFVDHNGIVGNRAGGTCSPKFAPGGLAVLKALALLKSRLPIAEWARLEESGQIQIRGRRNTYCIFQSGQTAICGPSGRYLGNACLQLTAPAPSYDRMLAEYLLIKNDEQSYLRTANVEWSQGVRMQHQKIAFVLVLGLIGGLAASLIWVLWVTS